MIVFTWSIYNGAVYYIDVFGTRFQKELDQLKKDVAKWQMSPDIGAKTPGSEHMAGLDGTLSGDTRLENLSLGAAAHDGGGISEAIRKDYFPETRSSVSGSEDYSLIERASGDGSSTALDRQAQSLEEMRSRGHVRGKSSS